MIAGFLVGSAFWFVMLCWYALRVVQPQIKAKTFASVRYCKRRKQWLVTGDVDAVVSAMTYDKHDKPGSVKYID